ncbi:MAG: hypothetical protein AAGA18_12900 [Verrucomicrobiota bacterium]
MKKNNIWVILAGVALIATNTNAQVTIGNSGGGSSSSANWTVTANPLSVAGNPGTPSATGTLTNAAAGDSFSYVISGVNNWDLTANPANFETYKGNLTSASTIKFSGNNGIGVGNNKLDVLGEGIVYTFDTTGLTASGNQLLLNQVDFNLGTNSGDKMDFVFWDSDTNTIVDSQYNLKPNASYAPGTPITVTTGDQLYVAVGAGNSNNWRVKALVMDIEAGASGSSFDAVTVNNLDDPVNPVPVVTLTYDEPGGASTVILEAHQDDAAFYFSENADVTSAPKMILDANNVLTLVDPTNPTNDVITLNPNPLSPSIQIDGVDVLTQSSGDLRYLSSNISISSGTGTNSVVGGDLTNNLASDLFAVSLGFETEATDTYAVALGFKTEATANGSTALGVLNEASGYASFAGGAQSTALGTRAIALGASARAYGDYSVALGHSNIADGFSQIVVGRYNQPQGTRTSSVDTDLALIVGNGAGESLQDRSNAFTVNWAGSTWMAGDLEMEGGIKAPGLARDSAHNTVLTKTGRIGSKVHEGPTNDKWIKLGEMMLDGSYLFAGADWDIYPGNYGHGNRRQRISVHARNDGSQLAGVNVALINLDSGFSPAVKDVQVIRKAGSGINGNVLSVWAQLGDTWITGQNAVSVHYYQKNNSWNEFITEPSITYTAIPDSGTVYEINTFLGPNTVDGDWTVTENVTATKFITTEPAGDIPMFGQ